MLSKFWFISIFFIFTHQIFAQIDSLQRKNYTAVATQNAPIIDGMLDDQAWDKAPAANNFVMYYPGDGDPIPETHKTTVKVIYDDNALYIAATLIDKNSEKIVRQFTQRDNLEQSDYFQVDINT